MSKRTFIFLVVAVLLSVASTIYAVDQAILTVGEESGPNWRIIAGALGSAVAAVLGLLVKILINTLQSLQQKVRVLMQYVMKVCDKLEIDYEPEDFR